MPRSPRFTQDELRTAIARSRSWAETLRALGYRSAGGNWKTLQKYAAKWRIPTDHFDPYAASREVLYKPPVPLEEVLIKGSTYHRSHLKRRLFAEGLKKRECELCGQGEIWRGRRMALILDHINGDPRDNRLENLRIVCPNCDATLETHCGRKNGLAPLPRPCKRCGREFFPEHATQSHCSHKCGSRWDRSELATAGGIGVARPESRRVERPPYEQLMREIEETSYLAVGRNYGVSDNAIRKWVRQYERERARAGERRDQDGDDPQLRLAA
jgi:HNH endonuclease